MPNSTTTPSLSTSTNPAPQAEYPQIGERIMGREGEMKIAGIPDDQPEAERYFKVLDEEGVEHHVYLDNGSWFLMDAMHVTSDEELVIEDDSKDDDDINGERFRADMEKLTLKMPEWHAKLEKARLVKESAKAPSDVYKAQVRLTVLIEIVNRLEPSYYEGPKRQGILSRR